MVTIDGNRAEGMDRGAAPDPVCEALARSYVYRFLAAAFGHPDRAGAPSPRELADALPGAADFAHPGLGVAALEVLHALAATPAEALRDGYVRCFGHLVRGAHPLYETEYGRGDGLLQAHEISDVAAFYRAAGLRPRADAHERDDHLTLELELLQFVARKEAHGHETGESALAEAMRELRTAFLRDHLAGFAIAAMRRLGAEPGFYGALGRFTEGFLARECVASAVTVPDGAIDLREPLLGPDEEVTCGTPGGTAATAAPMEV